MKRLTLILITTLITTACAQRPNAIAPVPMGNAYASTSCTTARSLLAEKRADLESLSAQQRAAATGDAIGVFLVLVPVSSLTGGDRAGEIATVKGQVLALEQRMQGC